MTRYVHESLWNEDEGENATSVLHQMVFDRVAKEGATASLFGGHPVLKKIKEDYVLGNVAFLFDMDGTLTAGIPGVHDTDPDYVLKSMLEQIHEQTQGATAIVTGRPEYYLENLLPDTVVPRMTEFGAIYRHSYEEEIFMRGGKGKNVDTEIKLIRDTLEGHFAGNEDVCVEEHKKLSITIEFTKAVNPEALEVEIETKCRQYVEQRLPENMRDHFYVRNTAVPHNRVIDVLPRGIDKGEATESLMRQTEFRGKTPVFFGDSSGDLPGMDMAQEYDGFALGVGEGAPKSCDYVFLDMVDVHTFLLDVIEARDLARGVDIPYCQSPLTMK